MLATAQIEKTDRSTTTMPAQPTQVVDVKDWLDRAQEPVRPFTPSICEYVPRHRAEAPQELT
ncbi:hypothetical protein [Nocardioides dilutus]